jgi:hypothetical protein
MKRANKDDKVAGGAVLDLSKLDDKALLSLAKPLLQLVCEACDAIAEGGDIYISIGATKKRDTFTVTLHDTGSSISVFSSEALFLLEKVPELL